MSFTLPWALSAFLLGAAAPRADDPAFAAMSAELTRSTSELRLSDRPPPYFISYWVVDHQQHDTEATLGALLSSVRSDGRRVRVEVRVGSPTLDNSNFMGSGGMMNDIFSEAALLSPRPAPVKDGFTLRHALWLATDGAYKNAVETLEKKLAARQTEMSSDDAGTPDFVMTPPATVVVEDLPEVGASEPHEAYVRTVSAIFREYPTIQDSTVHLVVSTETRHLLSSDGSVARVPTPYTELNIECRTQASDGMMLSRSGSLPSLTVDPPAEADAMALARRLADELTALEKAPVLEDYSGPVLFEGMAAPQVVNELLSEALSGTPAPKGAEAFESPLGRKLGKRILPTDVSAIDDPTRDTYRGLSLLGEYRVDDEGVPAEKVSLVEQGRLRSFLMSRTPRKEIRESNGHGRSGLVGWARGRVGNLILSSQRGMASGALRARLLRAVREERLPFGIIVKELEPRASATNGQVVPEPHLVYRLTPDGKTELVRGATFGPLSVRDLRDILAVGNDAHAFGFALPSAGGFAIPTSVVSPSLLFEEVEMKRRNEPNKRPPLVPRPTAKDIPQEQSTAPEEAKKP